MDINKYVKYTKDKILAAVELRCYIPRSYENYKLLTIADMITTLGVIEIEANGESGGLMLPAVIKIQPALVEEVTRYGKDYICVHVNQGSQLMDRDYVKNGTNAYYLFTEFIQKARIPDFISYEQYAFLFDKIVELTGSTIRAEHSIYELIFAQLCRDPDTGEPYRYGKMDKHPDQLSLVDVHATGSLTAKLTSGYLNDGINAALVKPSKGSRIEDKFRA